MGIEMMGRWIGVATALVFSVWFVPSTAYASAPVEHYLTPTDATVSTVGEMDVTFTANGASYMVQCEWSQIGTTPAEGMSFALSEPNLGRCRVLSGDAGVDSASTSSSGWKFTAKPPSSGAARLPGQTCDPETRAGPRHDDRWYRLLHAHHCAIRGDVGTRTGQRR